MYVGTSSLNFKNNLKIIVAKSVGHLAKSMASEKRKISVSRVIRKNGKWNKKADKVNQHFKDIFKIASVDYTDKQ